MDIKTIRDLADPLMLGHKIQTSVDSIAGQHVNMTSLDIFFQTIHDLNPIPALINLIIILIIALLTYFAAKFADRMLENYIPKVVGKVEMELDETAGVMVRRVVSASIYILGLTLIIFQIPQLSNLATIVLASAGIAGLAIGYAAKDSLANFTSGIFIAIFRPFRVGDLVGFRADYGRVEDLTLRHTVIQTWDNRRIIVPNNVISSEPITNWTIRDAEITWTVDFDLSHPSDIDRAREIILEIAKNHPMVFKDREIKVLLTSSKNEDLTLSLYIHIPGRDLADYIGCDIREAVKKRFDVEGIKPAVK